MTLHQIKTMLYARKIKPVNIADKAGVSHTTVRIVLNGYGTSRKIQQTIADMLNRPYEKLWSMSRHRGILSKKRQAVND
ncbi:MAG TPA: hypothetical protein DDW17_09810 [Deltaproteobacteria bacterium]|nr:hypothetical protein [Deltaproteobacteria bacterium]